MKQTVFLSLDLELNQPSGDIIEVGVCVGDIQSTPEKWEVKNWYIDPQETISPFITGLTGISDQTIAEKAVTPETMIEGLSEIIEKHNPFVNPVTWGGGDMDTLLKLIRSTGKDFPYFGRRWIDVKTIFTFMKLTSTCGFNAKQGLKSAMQSMGLGFEGDAHRADVDAFNTLRFWQRLCDRQSKRNDLIQQLSKT